MERLAFGYGGARQQTEAPSPARPFNGPPPDPAFDAEAPAARPERRRDWAFLGLMAFTAVLFFRPQDMIPPLGALHLAELSALVALGALASGRLARGLPVSRITPELGGVLAMALVILATAPFSVWMGGAIGTFTELYAKVVLIFVLMVNTVTTPRRVRQFIWLIVAASGYIAGRAVLDYVSGVNLIENGRVQGSVGGMFKNPNDLALNMVAVLPLAAVLCLEPARASRRALAALCAVLMVGAIVATQSRSGTVGLAAMALVLAVHLMKRSPGLVAALALVGMFAMPFLPSSYWQRLASITDESLDQTGSREARSILMTESLDAFTANPLTGVGAGQFKNYNPEGRQEAWRESHNSVLQVAAELGITGLLVFFYLVGRALYAPMQTQRLLARMSGARRASQRDPAPPLPREEHEMLGLYAAGVSAALVGWFVCALFASVAYHWTFYYLLALAAAPRDYLLARVSAATARQRTAASRATAVAGVQA